MIPRYELSWGEGENIVTVKPRIQFDQSDTSRTYVDPQEFHWTGYWEEFEIKFGVSIENWGVTESQQLVNVVNQINLADSIYGESKLGQGMLAGKFILDAGELAIYALPYFRPRVFPTKEGRPAARLNVRNEEAIYENDSAPEVIDVAARLSYTVGSLDFALSVFNGTNREPQLLPNVDQDQVPFFVPRYNVMTQYGLDAQLTLGALLLKAEAIARQGRYEDMNASTAGFEYTFFDILSTGWDIGILSEHLRDSRVDDVSVNAENDVFGGIRLAANDASDTSAIFGYVQDIDDGTSFMRIQAERRFFDVIKVSMDTTIIIEVDELSPIYNNRNDGFVNLQLEYFY